MLSVVYLFSFRPRSSLRSWQSSVSLFSLLAGRPNETNQSGMTLEKARAALQTLFAPGGEKPGLGRERQLPAGFRKLSQVLQIHRLVWRLIFALILDRSHYLNAENSPFLPLDPNPLSGQVNQVDPLERTRRWVLKIRHLVQPLSLFF